MYRVNTNDAKQREWFVFDNRLVLPEYLIEFDLITQATREEEEGSTEEIKSKEKEDENAEEGDTNNETKVSATVIDEQSQRMKMAVELLGRKLTFCSRSVRYGSFAPSFETLYASVQTDSRAIGKWCKK